MTILATIVLLGVLIFVHELGHFWAAKAVGVGVERFSIGLGPRLWGFRRGETEYVIAAIPLGGYVKMQGMEDEVMERLEGGASEEPRVPGEKDFDGKPIWARAFVISAGVIMNMLFAFALYTATAAFWGVNEPATTRVMTVQEGLLPAGTESLASIVPGATLARIGETTPETWGDVQRAFVEASPGRVTVVTDDPAASFSVAIPDSEEDRISLVRALERWIPAVVGSVNPGSAADAGGVESGDSLISVAGVPVESWADMVRELGARPGEQIQLLLRRDGSELMRMVELSEVVDGDTGERRGVLGVVNPTEETRAISVSFGEAVSNGWAQTVGFTRLIVGFVRDLFTFNVSPRSVGSIGTIAQASGQAAASGLDTFLNFMAFFSINLAVLNLLPIPILDGGHLVFLAIELVRGQALSIEQRIRWSQVGLFLVVGLMVWALGNDVLRALGL